MSKLKICIDCGKKISGEKRCHNCYMKWLNNGNCKTHFKNGHREHRLIMEKRIGRKLKNNEVIHHIDKNTKNNNKDNLILFRNNTAHLLIHCFCKRHNLNIKNFIINQDWLYG
jgi:hypothetical protein